MISTDFLRIASTLTANLYDTSCPGGEMADTTVSNTVAERRAGSSPALGTRSIFHALASRCDASRCSPAGPVPHFAPIRARPLHSNAAPSHSNSNSNSNSRQRFTSNQLQLGPRFTPTRLFSTAFRSNSGELECSGPQVGVPGHPELELELELECSGSEPTKKRAGKGDVRTVAGPYGHLT